jgi:hypothetical protein
MIGVSDGLLSAGGVACGQRACCRACAARCGASVSCRARCGRRSTPWMAPCGLLGCVLRPLLFLPLLLPVLTAAAPPYTDHSHDSKACGESRKYRPSLSLDYVTSGKRCPLISYFHGHSNRYALSLGVLHLRRTCGMANNRPIKPSNFTSITSVPGSGEQPSRFPTSRRSSHICACAV